MNLDTTTIFPTLFPTLLRHTRWFLSKKIVAFSAKSPLTFWSRYFDDLQKLFILLLLIQVLGRGGTLVSAARANNTSHRRLEFSCQLLHNGVFLCFKLRFGFKMGCKLRISYCWVGKHTPKFDAIKRTLFEKTQLNRSCIRSVGDTVYIPFRDCDRISESLRLVSCSSSIVCPVECTGSYWSHIIKRNRVSLWERLSVFCWIRCTELQSYFPVK